MSLLAEIASSLSTFLHFKVVDRLPCSFLRICEMNFIALYEIELTFHDLACPSLCEWIADGFGIC